MTEGKKILDVDRYNKLCDHVRHILTDARAYDRITNTTIDLLNSLMVTTNAKRRELVERIRMLEEMVDNLESQGEVEDGNEQY